MQAYPVSNPSEIHYHVQEIEAAFKVNPTVAKIIQLNPNLVLGESNLLKYDSENELIVLSPPFQKLLKLLVELEELDNSVLSVKTLYELNAILQKSQGVSGGLLRKAGTERWHLEDGSNKTKYRSTFELLLKELGFYSPKSIESSMTVDHCIVFGARAERMERRIVETLKYLNQNLNVTGHIFLLGSNRKLIVEEIEFLKGKFEKLNESDREYWNEVLSDSEQATEANAFVCLWECTVPQEMRIHLNDKLIGIKSTRIGSSYSEQYGHRVTTEITAEDWMAYYKAEEPQAVFAVAEQPYIRLADQLRLTVLSKGKKVGVDELIVRIANSTFYFASPVLESTPLLSVIFDEIGRNIYRVTDTLKYLESLD